MNDQVKTFVCPRRAESLLPHTLADGAPSDLREDGSCRYCGSSTEDQFFAHVEAGKTVDPTDKSYKVYIHGTGTGKFYFQHLSPEGRSKFIDLYNERKMVMAYPGHFYVRPYFTRIADGKSVPATKAEPPVGIDSDGGAPD